MADDRSHIYCNTCFRMFIVTTLTSLGAIWLWASKPIPVIRGTEPLSIIVPIWYMLMAFPVLGMLISDFIELVGLRISKLPAVELGLQITFLVLLASTRLTRAIPISGHTMLFTYFILRRITVAKKAGMISIIELSIAILFTLLTIYMKLFIWDDPRTLVWGAITGVALGMISISLYRYKIIRV
jgi:hypothetical protein